MYLLTILDTSSTKICEELQTLLDGFIRGETKKHWASANYLHSDKAAGSLGFFDIVSFVKGLKLTWMKRYILGTKDAWTDILDHRFNIINREKFRSQALLVWLTTRLPANLDRLY